MMPQDMWVLNQLAFKGDVFDGIASTGGIWTLLNGIFLVICGRGLLDVLLGMTQTSPIIGKLMSLSCRTQAIIGHRVATLSYPEDPTSRG